jgi:hypothetical protein
MFRLAVTAFVLVSVTSAWAALRPRQEMQMPQPTPEHAQLLKGVGEWEGTFTVFMPGAPESTTPCKESVTAIGPFWTTSRFTCDWQGMPFVGSGVMGFDPERKVFVGTWVDAVSTHLIVMQGKMDPAKKALVMTYEAPDMMTGKLTPHRIETVHESADAYTSTFYMGAGEGTKHMAIAMQRKK